MTKLFDIFKLKSLELKNRVVMPPMCQYSVFQKDGKPNEWHYVHYTTRAIGGAGLIIIEMTNVEPDGRLTDQCLGIWSDDHIQAFAKIIQSCQSYGAKVGIQIAHAGRKAEDAIQPVSSSPYPFSEKYKTPRELSTEEVKQMVEKFKQGFRRAIDAGVDTIEIHGAHGYLIHQFHSPWINKRNDEYGKNLSLFGTEIIQAAKEVMPNNMPLIMRVSAREYSDGGYGIDHILSICERYRQAGVDIFHITSGGEGSTLKGVMEIGEGYQVPFAETIKKELGVPVIAVGCITDPVFANSIVQNGQTDLVALGRELLRNPYWPIDANLSLTTERKFPQQYAWAY